MLFGHNMVLKVSVVAIKHNVGNQRRITKIVDLTHLSHANNVMDRQDTGKTCMVEQEMPHYRESIQLVDKMGKSQDSLAPASYNSVHNS